jgi:competence protein ComEC
LPPGNPSDFDYRAYLARRGVHFTVSLSDPSDIVLLTDETDLRARLLTGIRSFIQRTIQTTIPTKEARAILFALLLGDRSELAPDVKEQFQHTGLMHLLAISGLHVMIIGLAFYSLLLPVLKRLSFAWAMMEWTRSTVTLTILLVYCLITGAPASVVRAFTMTAVVLGGVLTQRTYQPLNALGAAAIFLLVLNENQIFDVGFQLSFVAVGGILIITPALQRLLPAPPKTRRISHSLVTTTYVSVAATLATMPVTLYHFGYVAFGGLLLNIIAIPITVIVLAGAVTTVVFHGLAGSVTEIIGLTTDLAVRVLLETAAVGDRLLGWTLVQEYVQSPLLLLAIVAAILFLVHWHEPRKRWRRAIVGLAFLTAFTWLHVLSSRTHELKLLFFDVNQGDAVLIELPNSEHILIDGGDKSSFVDQGKRTIIPHLRRHGINRLAGVIISHPHRDHMGGVLTVLNQVAIDRIIYNGQQYHSNLFDQIVRATDSLKIPLQAVNTGDTLDFDPTVRMQVLAPFNPPEPGADANEASVVVRMQYREITCLFTGDIERDTEGWLVQSLDSLLAVDLIKAPHHGSGTSSTPPLVRAATAAPEDSHFVVISADRNNKFDHPDPDVVNRWRTAGANVRRTMDGAVWLRTTGRHIQAIDWR